MTPADLDTRIEQAIAYGRTTTWITTHLGVTTRHVEWIRERLDVINRTPDNPDVTFPPAPHGAIRELVDAICPRRTT